jgi:hypothetical protein
MLYIETCLKKGGRGPERREAGTEEEGKGRKGKRKERKRRRKERAGGVAQVPVEQAQGGVQPPLPPKEPKPKMTTKEGGRKDTVIPSKMSASTLRKGALRCCNLRHINVNFQGPPCKERNLYNCCHTSTLKTMPF